MTLTKVSGGREIFPRLEWMPPSYKSTKEKQIVHGQLVTCDTLFKVSNFLLPCVSAYPEGHYSHFPWLP